jgi:hypothetical protein
MSGEVELIASGYEWTCPSCGVVNEEIEVVEEVSCVACGENYQVENHFHAEGE